MQKFFKVGIRWEANYYYFRRNTSTYSFDEKYSTISYKYEQTVALIAFFCAIWEKSVEID